MTGQPELPRHRLGRRLLEGIGLQGVAVAVLETEALGAQAVDGIAPGRVVALGQLARRYYAGGRVMTTALLRETYQGLLEPAQQMQTRFLPQIRQKAGTLDAAQVMAIVRGG